MAGKRAPGLVEKAGSARRLRLLEAAAAAAATASPDLERCLLCDGLADPLSVRSPPSHFAAGFARVLPGALKGGAAVARAASVSPFPFSRLPFPFSRFSASRGAPPPPLSAAFGLCRLGSAVGAAAESNASASARGGSAAGLSAARGCPRLGVASPRFAPSSSLAWRPSTSWARAPPAEEAQSVASASAPSSPSPPTASVEDAAALTPLGCRGTFAPLLAGPPFFPVVLVPAAPAAAPEAWAVSRARLSGVCRARWLAKC
mmetsp:Transcript_51884/g.118212  ORF Transcript_51884/g.118212 Transcript_51884/m.118212 type:complete len:260 (-) Transcript_51884:596-1375(-)